MKSKGEFIKKNIAQLSKEPTLVSQSEIPNFVEFVKIENYEPEIEEEEEEYIENKVWLWHIVGDGRATDISKKNISEFTFKEKSNGKKHTFWGSINLSEIEYNEAEERFKYPTSKDYVQNAKNLISCMHQDDFCRENFKITQGTSNIGTLLPIIRIENKTKDQLHAFDFETAHSRFSSYIKLSEDNPFSEIKSILPRTLSSKDVINLEVKEYDFDIDFDPSLWSGSYKERFEQHKAANSKIIITDLLTSTNYEIKGTQTKENVNSNTYFISKQLNITAQNIRNCLMQNDFLSGNYNISIPYKDQKFGNIIHISPRHQNVTQNIKISSSNPEFISITGEIEKPIGDSIFKNSANASIELEVYTNTGSLLGENKFPEESLGTYMTTLRKSYHGQALWFDLNALIANRNTYSNAFLNANGWCDADTATDYRFIARRFDGVNHEPFYLSDVLFSITGYNRNLEKNDLESYIYNAQTKNIVKPLTNQPTLFHTKGQTQYFNFILSDENRIANHQTGITYKLYSQSRVLLAEKTIVSQGKNLAVVNTIKLALDEIIKGYEKVGEVEVYLNVAGEIKSSPLTFRILPECLYRVNDFAFLNALGGWNSFNFGGDERTDFKASSTNIFKTHTPNHNISSEIESVYSQDVNEQFSVKTMPIDAKTVEWLKEMSASIAVYELSSKRYIIVDEMNIRPNSKDELFEVEMKYRYSDSFNGRIK